MSQPGIELELIALEANALTTRPTRDILLYRINLVLKWYDVIYISNLLYNQAYVMRYSFNCAVKPPEIPEKNRWRGD